MSEVQSVPQTAAAALAGSLAAFPLVDVLDLLSRLGSSGELQVVAADVDRRLWVDEGDFLEPPGATPTGVLFELACVEGGWFSFVPSTAVPDDAARVPLTSLVIDVSAQLAEWRALSRQLPFDAVVRMSQSTPADEVQIRANQWRILGLVGPGHTVLEVLSTSLQPAFDTLRALQELVDGQLVVVELAEEEAGVPETPGAQWEAAPEPAPEASFPGTPLPGTGPVAEPNDGPAVKHNGGIMPPPITGDPWSTPTRVAAGPGQPSTS